MSDTEIALIGRSLAQALMQVARNRDDTSKREVSRLHTELCAAFRNEQAEPSPEPPPEAQS
jgi:hypothetical protein